MVSKSPSGLRTSSHHKFWKEFFMLYKGLPALWNTHSLEYKNRNAKLAAYDELAVKLSEFKPNSGRGDVIRQINIFRTNYRRERARLRRCPTSRVSLWYYDLLSFLDDQKRSSSSKSVDCVGEQNIIEKTDFGMDGYFILENMDSENSQSEFLQIIDDHECDSIIDEDIDIYASYTEDPILDNGLVLSDIDVSNIYKSKSEELCNNADEECNINNDFPLSTVQEPAKEYLYTTEKLVSNNATEHEPVSEKTTYDHNVTTAIIENVDRSITSMSMEPVELKDAFTMTVEDCSAVSANPNFQLSSAAEILARSWALQYDEMSTQQKIHARKAIADILFAGCMGKLGNNQ